MPKINQEEYEVLKKKQEKGHKYIAREKEGHVIVFTDYHGKSEYRWLVTINEDDLKYESLFNSSKVFQFIKWEDEEPYEIAELIEEYENSPEYVTYISNERTRILSNDLWSKLESEETEVKTKQELIDKWESAIGAAEFYGRGKEDRLIEYMRNFVDDLNRLDEPEVLSQEWIDEHKESWQDLSVTGYSVPEKDLQNLLVPKQELPVIPKFVAEVIVEHKELGYDVYDSIDLIIETNGGGLPSISNWVARNIDKYARAWLDGYEVEEEQKYYVLDKENATLLKKSAVGEGVAKSVGTNIYNAKSWKDEEKYQLTEQEIKDYDPRYMTFAKPVEELEE